jgi:hypothetical protein
LDGTFDRVQASHRVGLFDMDLKYADVLPAAQILELLPAARVGDARSSSAPSRPSVGGDPAGPVPEVGTAPGAGGG